MPKDADCDWQSPRHTSRIYNDQYRRPHHSFPSPNRSSVDMQKVLRVKGKIPNIAIIGAGISGLRCADLLIKSGAKVTIFEARDRIGGRVHQVESGGYLMDIGANWIHGTQNNAVADIARRTKTLICDTERRQAIIDSQGNRIDDRLASEVSEIVWGMIAKAFQYSDEHSAEIDKSKSLMDFFREQLPQVEKDPYKQSLVLEEAHIWGVFVGDSVERQSLKFFFLEECLDGENVFVAGTYKKILAEIAATALADAEIHFNEEAVFFKTHHNSTTSPSPRISIHTRSGRQETYDEVVLTAPLGWLKRHKYDAFPSESPFPPHLLQAIDNIFYGRLEKVYVTFPTAFWKHDRASSTDSSNSDSPTNCSSSMSPSSIPSSDSYPLFTHFFTPDYTNHPANTPWNNYLVNLAAFSDSTAHPTLLFYLYGPCATHLAELLKDIPASPSPASPYHIMLRSFFQPYYSRLPNYDSFSPSCIPAAFLATNWQLDPFAGNGSYTNFQVGLEDGDKDLEALRKGVGEETGLWLAGEHTAPSIALGTTAGAYWSGEAVARRIAALYDALEVGEQVALDEEQMLKKVPSVERKDGANMSGLAL